MLTKAKGWLAAKATQFLTEADPEWFRRNGFYRLAEMKESGSGSGGYTPPVSDEAALQVGAFYCCVKILAEDHSVQPCFLYQRAPGSKELRKADDHRLYSILHDLPNDELSANSFFETMTAHAAVCGTGYAEIKRDRPGDIASLVPIMPDHIQRHRTESGQLFYKIWDRGKWESVPRTDIFDLPGFSWTADGGNRVADYARMTLGLAIAQESYASNFFARDSTPGVVLERPPLAPPLNDEAVMKAKSAWKRMVQSHDVAILQEGTQAKVISKSNTESQLLEQRIQQIRAVAMYFRMPAYKLGDMDRMTWGNVVPMRNEYTANVIKPWNYRWRGAIYRCLLSRSERAEGFYGEHHIEAFQQGDFMTQSESFRSMLDRGVVSINEVRGWINMNPVEGGDTRFIQINMQSIVDAATGAHLQDNDGRVPVGNSSNSGQGDADNGD